MKSETSHAPAELMNLLSQAVKSMCDKMAQSQQGDTHADKEILKLIFYTDEHIKKLIYSFLYKLEHDGKLNAANIPVLQEIEEMDDEIRKHTKGGIKEEDYIRRLAAHFEALTEEKLKKAEKKMKHAELAEKYAKLAQEHEKIAKDE